MKYKIFRAALLLILAVLLVLINMPFEDKNSPVVFTIPGLPRPIAKTPVVITSAGQNSDTYIIQDITNQLMISSLFMPQANDTDLEDVKTVVFAVGYSSLGAKYKDTSYEEEINRVKKLLEKAKKDKLTVLVVALGGDHADRNKTEGLLRLAGARADYLIGLRGSNSEIIMTELAEEENIPLTLVNSVNDVLRSFASAFR